MAFDKSALITETTLTHGWLERTLQGCLKTTATLSDCKATRIGVGQGFLSFILHLELKWTQETKQHEELPSALILKVPTTTTFTNIDKVFDIKEDDAQMKAMKEMMKNFDMKTLVEKAHQCECEMYRLMAPWHKELRMPQCYYQEKISDESPGAIIMEYLGDRGVVNTLAKPLNLESILQVTDALATLHAWCMQNRSMWEGNPYLKSGFGYFMFMGNEQAKQAFQAGIDMMKKEWPDKFDPLADRMHDLGDKEDPIGYIKRTIKNACTEYNMPSVLAHGDMWISNMIFHKNTDERANAGDVLAIIDWQTVHPGCAAEDFTRLLTSSVTKTVRRQHTDTILKRYYDTLTAKLDGTDPGFTLDTLKNAYRQMFPLGATLIMGALPFFAKQKAFLGDDPDTAAAEMIDRTQGLLEDSIAVVDAK